MTKSIILCADDFGQNENCSQGIIELISQQRLSATSCITTAKKWPNYAKWLHPHQNIIDIGLHINLTEDAPDLCMSLSKLILASYSGKLDRQQLTRAINRQLDNFENELGKQPDFIDGHQHVHQLPMVRDILFSIYQQRLPKTCYIRNTGTPKTFSIKKTLIYLFSCTTFQKSLTDLSIPHNKSFSGIYDFGTHIHYEKIFPKFLNEIEDAGLIMCHPARFEGRNKMDRSKNVEYQYFMSNNFIEDCKQAKVKLSRFNQ